MIIGTVRPEEARVSDTYAGYHQFHMEETQEPHGSFEIFWHDMNSSLAVTEDGTDEHEAWPSGWYWHACFPGCMPDGEPSGPFASSRQALEDADPWHPEFDE